MIAKQYFTEQIQLKYSSELAQLQPLAAVSVVKTLPIILKNTVVLFGRKCLEITAEILKAFKVILTQ
jgi:hypothetical protein